MFFLCVFSGKFGENWAKIFHTPKNMSAPTPMTGKTEGKKAKEEQLRLPVLFKPKYCCGL